MTTAGMAALSCATEGIVTPWGWWVVRRLRAVSGKRTTPPPPQRARHRKQKEYFPNRRLKLLARYPAMQCSQKKKTAPLIDAVLTNRPNPLPAIFVHNDFS